MLLSVAELKSLFGEKKYVYPGQRDHSKGQKTRIHTRDLLWGNAQQFAGVYVEAEKRYYNIDGYHRAQSVIAGNAWFLPGADIELTVHRVADRAQADALYDQYNSAVAAKKTSCYFDSGMRDAGIRLTSLWCTGRGINSAVQYAADLMGTVAALFALRMDFVEFFGFSEENCSCALLSSKVYWKNSPV